MKNTSTRTASKGEDAETAIDAVRDNDLASAKLCACVLLVLPVCVCMYKNVMRMPWCTARS